MEETKEELTHIIRENSRHLEPIPTGMEPKLEVLPGIKAVLFDIYGTLFVSGSGDISIAEESATDPGVPAILAKNGIEAPEEMEDVEMCDVFYRLIREDHARRKAEGVEYPEVEIREIWGHTLKEIGVEASTEAVERIATEYECRVNPVWPMPGLGELLEGLGGRGLRMGIVSNSQFYTPLMFEGLTERPVDGWGMEEELCVWSFRVREGKPSGRLYAAAAAALAKGGIGTEEALYVGNDMLKDVGPAAAVGFRTALFAGDERSLRLRDWEPGGEGGPDVIVTALGQVAECLETIPKY